MVEPRDPSRVAHVAVKAPSEHARTCVGCRGRGSRSVLVRVVCVDGLAVVDTRRRMPGRGAWLHPDPTCLAQALRRRALTRALRVSELDVTGLETGATWTVPTDESDGMKAHGHPMSTSR